MPAKTASNLDIAKQANAHARADFATWQMMAKLRSLSALPQDAQDFYAGYLKLLERPKANPEDAGEATIKLVYRSYYAKMGGTGTPPRIEVAPKSGAAITPQPASNVTPFRKIKPQGDAKASSPGKKPALPVALIFLGLVALVVAVRYLM
jgi:hypothetical protein